MFEKVYNYLSKYLVEKLLAHNAVFFKRGPLENLEKLKKGVLTSRSITSPLKKRSALRHSSNKIQYDFDLRMVGV